MSVLLSFTAEATKMHLFSAFFTDLGHNHEHWSLASRYGFDPVYVAVSSGLVMGAVLLREVHDEHTHVDINLHHPTQLLNKQSHDRCFTPYIYYFDHGCKSGNTPLTTAAFTDRLVLR